MNKGFTLIELLAVIVVLAIIALIAVPVVLNIINDSKESSLLRSAEFYLDAVEYTIADAFLYHGGLDDNTYPITPNGDICKVNETPCKEENVLKVEVNGDKPTGGTITIASGNISSVELVLNERTIGKNSKGELVYLKYLDDVCKLVTGTEKTAGAKYTCEVKEGTSYTFYVLTTPQEGDTTINLIMDRNIYYDATAGTGSVADATNKGLVAWQTSGKNADGPVTAMDYLYNATKDWTNIPNIEMNYTDEGNTGDNGYGTIVTTDNITKITKKDGTAVTVLTDQEGYNNLKARMPYQREVAASNGSNEYLYENLNGSGWSGSGTQPTNNINGIYGYWTLSSYAVNSYGAWYVYYHGLVNLSYDVGRGSDSGVRAVINLKI